MAFDDPAALAAAFAGVDTFFNTYWIRFERGESPLRSHPENASALTAATQAGVAGGPCQRRECQRPRADHVFRGQGSTGRGDSRVGLPHAIVRPTLTFGPGDILVNNLCWVLRRVPPSRSRATANTGSNRSTSRTWPALRSRPAGSPAISRWMPPAPTSSPSINSFDSWPRWSPARLGCSTRHDLCPTSRPRALGLLVRDVMLTRDEVTELTASLLVSAQPPAGRIGLPAWASAHADELGRTYHSELHRHYR